MAISNTNLTTAELKQYGNLPALAPPPGVLPSFTTRNEHAVVFHTLCSILLVILYVFLCLRLYAKIWIKRSPGFDDCKSLVIYSLMTIS